LVAVLAKPIETRAGVIHVGNGIRAGINASTFSSETGNNEPYFGLVVGVFGRWDISPVLQMQPELLFAQKGANYDADFGFGQAKGSMALSYIEVPVLVRWVAFPDSRFRPALLGGGAFSLLISSTHDYSTTGRNPSEQTGADLNNIRRFDLGLVLGFELELEAFGRTFIAEARYEEGLVDVDESDEGDSVRNRTFSITLGLFWEGH